MAVLSLEVRPKYSKRNEKNYNLKYALGINNEHYKELKFFSETKPIEKEGVTYFEFSKGFSKELLNLYQKGKDHVVLPQERYHFISKVIIKDYLGNNVGSLLFFKNAQKILDKGKIASFKLIITMLIIGAILSIILYFLVSKLLKPLLFFSHIMSSLSKKGGDLTGKM